MTRMMVGLFMILVPAVAMAQEQDPRAGKENQAPYKIKADRSGADQGPAQAPEPSAEQPEGQAPGVQPPPARARARRRGSMVGYVNDAIIESKVRLRFDTALHNTAPDRAEFFYAKCGCYAQVLKPGDDLYDPDAPGPGPGIATDLDFQQLYLWGEYAATDRFSAFGQVAVRSIQPQSFVPGTGVFPNRSGLGDLQAGIKLGLAASPERSVTALVQLHLPTGDASHGLGTDHASVEPALLFYERPSDRVALEAQVGFWRPLGGAAPAPTSADGKFSGDVIYYGIGPSYEAYSGDRVQLTPVVELVGWRVLNGQLTGPPGADASATNIVNLKVGARVSFAQGSIYFGYGHALTEATWYADIFRLEYRYAF